VLFGTILVLLRKVVRSKPYDAGTWLTLASNRRELSFTLLSGLYAYMFGTITGSPDQLLHCAAPHRRAMRLLHAGVAIAVIALWLGHEPVATADLPRLSGMNQTEHAIALVTPLLDTSD